MCVKLILLLLLPAFLIAQVPLNYFIPYGPSYGDQELCSGSDIKISYGPFGFFGYGYQDYWISSSGVISFQSPPSTFLPKCSIPMCTNTNGTPQCSVSNGYPVIAAFWADIDTSLGGKIYYRLISNYNDPNLNKIASRLEPCGPLPIFGFAVVITWIDIPDPTGTTNGTNSFQAILIGEGGTAATSYVLFYYNEISWTSSDGIYAFIGFDGGNGGGTTSYYYGSSCSCSVENILNGTNVQTPGAWYFEVDSSAGIVECDGSVFNGPFTNNYPNASCPAPPTPPTPATRRQRSTTSISFNNATASELYSKSSSIFGSSDSTATPQSNCSNTKSHTWIIIVVVAVSIILLLLGICGFCVYKLKKGNSRNLPLFESIRELIYDRLKTKRSAPEQNNTYCLTPDRIIEPRFNPSAPRDPPYTNQSQQDPLWIDSSKIKIQDSNPIGIGYSSKVYKAYMEGVAPIVSTARSTPANKYKDCFVAVKMVKSVIEHYEIELLKREIDTLKTIGYNEHISSLLGWSKMDNKPVLIFELGIGDLLTYVRSSTRRKLEFKEVLLILRQIVQGMKHISSLHLIHRDLAARNILMIDEKIVKISDFGLCCICDESTLEYQSSTYKRLPLKWLSLEAMMFRSFSEKSDVWSFGVLIYEILSGGLVPYPTLENSELVNYLKEGNRLKVDGGIPEEIDILMKDCWVENVDVRPSFTDLEKIFRNMLADENYGYYDCV